MVGGGKIKNKDQLSLAEARVEAELGKNCRVSVQFDISSFIHINGNAKLFD